MKSQAIRELEQLGESLEKQRDKINQLQHASISNGFSSKGDNYDRKQKEAEKELDKMNIIYQKKLNQATNLLRNL